MLALMKDPELIASEGSYELFMFAVVVPSGSLHILPPELQESLKADGGHGVAFELKHSGRRIAFFIEKDGGPEQHDRFRKESGEILKWLLDKLHAGEQLPDVSAAVGS